MQFTPLTPESPNPANVTDAPTTNPDIVASPSQPDNTSGDADNRFAGRLSSIAAANSPADAQTQTQSTLAAPQEESAPSAIAQSETAMPAVQPAATSIEATWQHTAVSEP